MCRSPRTRMRNCSITGIPEVLESVNGKGQQAVYYPTPGIEFFAGSGSTIDTDPLPSRVGPCRALFEEDGRCFAVIGDRLKEIHEDQTVSDRGFVGNDGKPATIVSNGGGQKVDASLGNFAQLFIVSALNGYVMDLSDKNAAVVLVTDPQFPTGRAIMGLYSDGHFIVPVKDSNWFQISDFDNGLKWAGFDSFVRSNVSDNIVAMAVMRRELWVFGSKTLEVWYNSGGSTPFLPFQGKVINIGCEAPFSIIAADGDQLMFVGAHNGCGMVYRISDAPQRVSTHYVERMIQSYQTTEDAEAYGYQENGHIFYVLTFPSANMTWVYDMLTGMWHQRGVWNPNESNFDAVRQRCHAFAFDHHLVGDFETATIFRQAYTIPTDDGQSIVRVRRCPHVGEELKWIYYKSATVDLETGLGLPFGRGANPQVMLRWSNDGGHVYTPFVNGSAGRQGEYRLRVSWNRLGRARDRVFEVRVSDPIPWRLLDFYMDLEGGTS